MNAMMFAIGKVDTSESEEEKSKKQVIRVVGVSKRQWNWNVAKSVGVHDASQDLMESCIY